MRKDYKESKKEIREKRKKEVIVKVMKTQREKITVSRISDREDFVKVDHLQSQRVLMFEGSPKR